jgi:hypothetical protein
MKVVRKNAIPGLPGALPRGEKLLWQGSPDWWSLALRGFRLRGIAIYFGILAGLRAAFAWSEGATPVESLLGALWLVVLGAAAIGLFCLYARLVARSSIYTITSRRIVMHIGVALPMTINFPFKVITAAALAEHSDGSGDLPFVLAEGSKASYMVLWPHARPWRFSQVEPMLRGVPDAGRVAAILAEALHSAKAEEAVAEPAMQQVRSAPAAAPARERSTVAA